MGQMCMECGRQTPLGCEMEHFQSCEHYNNGATQPPVKEQSFKEFRDQPVSEIYKGPASKSELGT